MAFNDTFLRACRMEAVDHIPVWFMRQAGRYQPEYRKIKEKYALLDLCRHPEICAQVTLLPIKQLQVDAAILFSDITLPLSYMGFDVQIVDKIGPLINPPVRSWKDILLIKPLNPYEHLPFVGETIRLLMAELSVPLIGFAGAPFTLASYLIEGGPTKNFQKTKSFMYNRPQDWQLLMQKLTEAMIAYLRYQHENGAQALQIFDSWAGNLSEDDYAQYVSSYVKQLFLGLKDLNIPLIYFGLMTGHLLKHIKESGCTVVGLDWRMDISKSRKILGSEIAVQGNLDPAAVLAPQAVLHEKTMNILQQSDQEGFIFNLGHGVLPETDPSTLQRLTDFVHEYSAKNISA